MVIALVVGEGGEKPLQPNCENGPRTSFKWVSKVAKRIVIVVISLIIILPFYNYYPNQTKAEDHLIITYNRSREQSMYAMFIPKFYLQLQLATFSYFLF